MEQLLHMIIGWLASRYAEQEFKGLILPLREEGSAIILILIIQFF
jgi:hypothetical protein